MEKPENRLTPVKFESKKQAKKVFAKREGFGWKVPIERSGSSHVPRTIKNVRILSMFPYFKMKFKEVEE